MLVIAHLPAGKIGYGLCFTQTAMDGILVVKRLTKWERAELSAIRRVDDVHPGILKTATGMVATPLAAMFNMSLSSGALPLDRREAIVKQCMLVFAHNCFSLSAVKSDLSTSERKH